MTGFLKQLVVLVQLNIESKMINVGWCVSAMDGGEKQSPSVLPSGIACSEALCHTRNVMIYKAHGTFVMQATLVLCDEIDDPPKSRCHNVAAGTGVNHDVLKFQQLCSCSMLQPVHVGQAL